MIISEQALSSSSSFSSSFSFSVPHREEQVFSPLLLPLLLLLFMTIYSSMNKRGNSGRIIFGNDAKCVTCVVPAKKKKKKKKKKTAGPRFLLISATARRREGGIRYLSWWPHSLSCRERKEGKRKMLIAIDARARLSPFRHIPVTGRCPAFHPTRLSNL